MPFRSMFAYDKWGILNIVQWAIISKLQATAVELFVKVFCATTLWMLLENIFFLVFFLSVQLLFWCVIIVPLKEMCGIMNKPWFVVLQVLQGMLNLTPYHQYRAPCRTSSRSPRTPTLSRATPSSCAVEPRRPYRSSSNATENGCTRMSTCPRSIRIWTQVR